MVRRSGIIATAAGEIRHLSRQRVPLSEYCTQLLTVAPRGEIANTEPPEAVMLALLKDPAAAHQTQPAAAHVPGDLQRPNADIRHPTSVYALRHPSPQLRNPILWSFVSFIVRGSKEGCRRDGYTHPASRRQGSEGPVTQEETL
jgi:hypothetical protein